VFRGSAVVLMGTLGVFRGSAVVLMGTLGVFRGTAVVLMGSREVFRGTAVVLIGSREVFRGTAVVLIGSREVFRGSQPGEASRAQVAPPVVGQWLIGSQPTGGPTPRRAAERSGCRTRPGRKDRGAAREWGCRYVFPAQNHPGAPRPRRRADDDDRPAPSSHFGCAFSNQPFPPPAKRRASQRHDSNVLRTGPESRIGVRLRGYSPK
jgi:hypothetical protein